MNVDEGAPSTSNDHHVTTKAKGRPSSKTIQQSDEEMDAMSPLSESESDEEVKPIRKGRKAPAAHKGKATTKKSTTVIEDSDEDIQAPSSAQPRSEHNEVRNPTPDVEEEEEKSLFDPPPMPGPSSLPQVIPEEPAGPKSRLVIHKMALINFKSYAGRQEIGPFHKVINIKQILVMGVDFFRCPSVVLLHRGSQWVRKIQYD
jgi:structural maintenance of chromosome 4